LGVVGFVDIGNSYDWLVNDERSNVSVDNFFSTLSVAVGGGIRYFTPVGPLRLDIAAPLYDPSGNANFSVKYLRYHIGLGHSF
jgi:translocation and assembly module TamA